MTLKEKRISFNITQDKLSKELNIPLRSYQYIESKNSCNLETAYKIAKYFNSTIEEIFFNDTNYCRIIYKED